MSDLEPLFEGGTLVEDGIVVGAWILDLHGLTMPQNPAGNCSMVAVGRVGGKAVGHRQFSTRGRLAPPAALSQVIREAEAATAWRDPGHGGGDAFCRFVVDVWTMGLWLRREAWAVRDMEARCASSRALRGRDDLPDRIGVDLRATLDAVGPFVATLDPHARDVTVACRECLAMTDDAYANLDPGFVEGAPLARLMGAMPGLPRAALDLWDTHPREEGRDLSRDRAALIDRLTWNLTDNKLNTTPERVGRILALGERFAALPAHDRHGCHHLMPHSDPAHLLADVLHALPRSWEPRTGDGWVGLLRCSQLAIGGLAVAGGDGLAAFLGGGGRWSELAGRIGPLAQDDGRGQIQMVSVNDMATAFAHQVIRPACPDVPPPVAVRAAQTLLYSGRGIHRQMEMAHRWHGRRPGMLASLPHAASDEWGAGLPDWTWRDVSVVVLRSSRDLVGEGATGFDVDGVEGLRHCVGGYAPKCRRGTTRIVGTRLGSADDRVRLSTAEFDVAGTPRLVQHRGARNASPPVIAVQAVESYAQALAEGTLTVDRPGLRPTSHADRIAADAGYDVHAPGAVAAALEAWWPLLPRSLRAVTPDALPALVAGLEIDGGRWWRLPGNGTPRARSEDAPSP